MTFYSDLDHMLNEYDRMERLDEIEHDMLAENSDFAVNGEDATVIPANFVLDADALGVRVHSGRGADFLGVEFIPGQYDDRWGRFIY